MPYAAGFQVIADNLTVREQVNATEVTVSFPATDPKLWPSGSWLGGGMFVQGQDHSFRNVDYGFYMMLVLDASGELFIDLGLHQTEEATVPLQSCMSTLIYAYTWQITGINASAPITLTQRWKNSQFVDYSMSALGQEQELMEVDVLGLPSCQSMINEFYTGNAIIDPFPYSRYVNYFQFGAISNQAITDSHWNVDLKEPEILRKTGWVSVDEAWTIEGDHSYLDHDLMWGGAAYTGLNIQYYQHPLQNPFELVFSYSGSASTTERILWDYSNKTNSATPPFVSESQSVTELSRHLLPVIIMTLGVASLLPFLLVRRWRKHITRI